MTHQRDEERDDPCQRRTPRQGYWQAVDVGAPSVPPPYELLPPSTIAPMLIEQEPTPVPWTNLYKYLGFMIRSDLLDDHAYARVLQKTKAAAEHLFPHHRLVRAWPLGQKLQLMQTIVLSVSTIVMLLLTSMRCA